MPDPLANISSEIANFLDYATVEKGLASNSIASYGRDLRKFAVYLHNSKLSIVSSPPTTTVGRSMQTQR